MIRSRGNSSEMFFRLCSRAPRITSLSLTFVTLPASGARGPSLGVLAREVPGLVVTPNAGHDGQQFYAIARKPFRPRETARYLKDPSYRYRRILFPLVGWALAPHGGRRLILAFAAIELLSVGLR